ncbi:DNA topoisomerase 3-beta-like [Lycorma delicatula]|uniref:DNA topoisomerase 3-beta-like n=1 Tax=Lycorma delicatula TaxID=130591 RepID=UPI003F517A83
MKTALMVAEKPSLAASLANILSNGRNTSKKGNNGACSVHEWNGQFKNEMVNFKMISVCGHVMSLDFIGKYNNWDRVDPICYNSTSTTSTKLVKCTDSDTARRSIKPKSRTSL